MTHGIKMNKPIATIIVNSLKMKSTICATMLAMLPAIAITVSAASTVPGGYPLKPVRILLGIAPGGGTDVVTRTVAQNLTERWGRSFIVDNRPGGAGALAMELAAQAQPDGYTLFVATLNNSATATMMKKVDFDVTKAYEPLIELDTQPYLLMINPSLPVNSVKELIAYAKARPGKLNYGSSGAGTASHLGVELLDSRTGMEMVHIPYKGASLVAIDLIAGQVQVLMGSAVTVAPHVKSGKLKALAVTSLRRSQAYPDLPTIAESGVPDFEVSNSHGMFAPAGTPQPILLALNKEIDSIMHMPDTVAKLAKDGAEPVPSNSPAQFKAIFAREIATWAKFFKAHPDLASTQR